MRQRAILKVNGNVIYDSGYSDRIEVKWKTDHEVAGDGKLDGYTMTVTVEGDTTQ